MEHRPFFCSHEQSRDYPVSTYKYPERFSEPLVKCPLGWIPYHTSCYKLIASAPKGFNGARQFCQSQIVENALSIDLFTVWDEYELEFGKSFFRSDSLPTRSPTDMPEGFFIGLEYTSADSQWSWVDQWPLTVRVRNTWLALFEWTNHNTTASITFHLQTS